MSLFWGRLGGGWDPPGGQRKAWADLAAGDLIALHDRKVWRVIEVRPVPAADWDEEDTACWGMLTAPAVPGQIRRRQPASREVWDRRPLNLILTPPAGGGRRHVRIRPYATFRDAWVLSPHYPVCRECGELWPCRELEISREVDQQSAEMARLEKILPGCCWSCGHPVTSRQKSIRFGGENLLLPGADPPVFHLRSGECAGTAYAYEKRWVAAGEGRRWRLQCPGHVVVHLDGLECTEGQLCPGAVRHNSFIRHAHARSRQGAMVPVPGVGGGDCLRCRDALARGPAVKDPPPGALL